MPYIKQEDRIRLGDLMHQIRMVPVKNAGELNYLITCLIHNYTYGHGERYQTYNDIMGVLEGAKLELYRRAIAPYEETKIKQNGDVKPPQGDGE